jgi:hypothetical protein
MIIEARLEVLRLIEESTSDPSLAAAARLKASELKIELALVEPTTKDRAEEARIAEEIRREEERVRLAEIHGRAHDRMKGRIITEEPRPS